MPGDLTGKYVSTPDGHENMDEFLKAMGKNAIQIGMAKKATVTIEIKQEGDKFTVTVTNPKGTTTNTAEIGKENDVTLPTGETGTGVVNWDGDRLVGMVKLKDSGREIHVTRELEKDCLVQTMKVNDVVFKRRFQKQ